MSNKKCTEREEALDLAEKLLGRPYADPDDDLCMLSRQLIRGQEVIDQLKKELNEQYDPMSDLINANRDQMLKMHEIAITKITTCIGNLSLEPTRRLGMIRKIVEALLLWHPMHGESWQGWPKESDV